MNEPEQVATFQLTKSVDRGRRPLNVTAVEAIMGKFTEKTMVIIFKEPGSAELCTIPLCKMVGERTPIGREDERFIQDRELLSDMETVEDGVGLRGLRSKNEKKYEDLTAREESRLWTTELLKPWTHPWL